MNEGEGSVSLKCIYRSAKQIKAIGAAGPSAGKCTGSKCSARTEALRRRGDLRLPLAARIYFDRTHGTQLSGVSVQRALQLNH